jgi:hypothetical protein
MGIHMMMAHEEVVAKGAIIVVFICNNTGFIICTYLLFSSSPLLHVTQSKACVAIKGCHVIIVTNIIVNRILIMTEKNTAKYNKLRVI